MITNLKSGMVQPYVVVDNYVYRRELPKKLHIDMDEQQWRESSVAEKDDYYIEQGYYKKIGALSPDAKWVKNRDRFYEDELRVLFVSGDLEGKIFDYKYGMAIFGGNPDKAPIRILLKGPCGHYH
jgi:hypothetical protein